MHTTSFPDLFKNNTDAYKYQDFESFFIFHFLQDNGNSFLQFWPVPNCKFIYIILRVSFCNKINFYQYTYTKINLLLTGGYAFE